MWRELFSEKFPDAVFYPPVPDGEIEHAQAKIGLPIPADLSELYFETNGVYFADAYMWIVWSIDDLIKENIYMHTSKDIAFYGKSFGNLLFYGSLGNGDLLAINSDLASPAEESVGIWDHEEGEYLGQVASLRDYFDK